MMDDLVINEYEIYEEQCCECGGEHQCEDCPVFLTPPIVPVEKECGS